MPAIVDPIVILDALRACLCSTLTAREDPPCWCGIVPGPVAYPDYCGCGGEGCGMAWARLDRIYPSTKFPAPDSTAATCATPLAAVLEVGVLRCWPTIQEGGKAPTVDAMANATMRATADAVSLFKAVRCCTEVTDHPYLLGVYLPQDAGDCGGGRLTVTVSLNRRRTP